MWVFLGWRWEEGPAGWPFQSTHLFRVGSREESLGPVVGLGWVGRKLGGHQDPVRVCFLLR